MADRKPLKVLPDGGGDSTGLGEFVAADTVGIVDGGTGLATVGSNQLLTGNGTSALTSESNLTFDGSTLTVTADQHITAGKALVVGGTTQYAAEAIVTPEVQVLGANRASASMLLAQYTADEFGPSLYFMKSRNASIGGNTVVQDDDSMGSLFFYANDGTDGHNLGAAIRANIDGTPGSNDTPGRLVFQTSADGTNSLVERLRIGADGNVKVSDGDLVIGTSGHGIDFSAHAHAGGMTSELLDDYEEGTFTPVFKYSTTAYSLNGSDARYTKVGDIVHFQIWADVTTSASNDSSIVYVAGLPFTSYNSVASHIRYSAAWEYYSGGHVPLFYLNQNNTVMTMLIHKTDGNQWANAASSQIYRSSGHNEIIVSGTYIAA